MQDPSYGISPQLLPHVHLISDFRFPIHHSLTAEMVVEMLLQAPKIVREIQPMSWTYLAQPPADGTVFLAWQPQAQRKLVYASDGYAWADPETQYQQEVKGYTIEILVHKAGWVLGKEMVTAHTRQRYRLINKHPNAQGSLDPSLWLVHYGAAEPQHRIPVNNIPNNPQIMMTHRERQALAAQGQLARRPFMLHDRQMWPQVNLGPGGIQMAPSYPQQAGSQQYLRQQGPMVGQPPAKRIRHTGPGQPPTQDPRLQLGMGEAVWDEEEAVQHGDALDFLTPRDISTLRYQQHHEWMEEIFSSPFAASQIAPVDLGLGLTGELAEITQGLLNPPDDSFSIDNTGKLVTESGRNSTYTRIETKQVEQFDKRVNAYIQKGEEELEAMREAHAKTMEKLRKGKTYLKAERQLKAVKHASHDDQDDPDFDPLDGVVKGVENSLRVKVGPRKEAICISKGGLIEEEPQFNDGPEQIPAILNGNGTPGELGQFDHDHESVNSIRGQNPSLLQQNSLTTSQIPTLSAAPNMNQQDQSEATDFRAGGGSEAQDGLDLIEDMDLDIPEIPEDEGESGAQVQDEWVMVDNNNGGHAAQTSVASSDPAKTANATPSTDIAGTTAPLTAAGNTPAASTTPGMFDGNNTVDDEFVDFTNLDSAGDALADFGTGDDGGAAGDALDALDFGDGDANLDLDEDNVVPEQIAKLANDATEGATDGATDAVTTEASGSMVGQAPAGATDAP